MTHDPLCTQPVRALSRPGLTVLNGTCDCEIIVKARADMLAKCIDWMLDPQHHPSEEAAAWAYAFSEALRELGDKR